MDWLIKRLDGEKRMIKAAPCHFAFACILSAIIIGFLLFFAFEKVLHVQSETIDALEKNHEVLGNAVKSNPNQIFQVLAYSNDPNAEKLLPSDTNSPALAYGLDGTKPMFSWNVKSQSWK